MVEGRWRQENHNPKVILGYGVSSRPSFRFHFKKNFRILGVLVVRAV